MALENVQFLLKNHKQSLTVQQDRHKFPNVTVIIIMPQPGAGWHTEWGRLAQVAKMNETVMKMVHFG